MNIQELWRKCKGLYEVEELFFCAILILVGLISFGLGRQSVNHYMPQTGETVLSQAAVTSASAVPLGGYVAAKDGTRYHLPWCAGAQQIKGENKRWFESKEEAEAAGYTPAGNCKGI